MKVAKVNLLSFNWAFPWQSKAISHTLGLLYLSLRFVSPESLEGLRLWSISSFLSDSSWDFYFSIVVRSKVFWSQFKILAFIEAVCCTLARSEPIWLRWLMTSAAIDFSGLTIRFPFVLVPTDTAPAWLEMSWRVPRWLWESTRLCCCFRSLELDPARLFFLIFIARALARVRSLSRLTARSLAGWCEENFPHASY